MILQGINRLGQENLYCFSGARMQAEMMPNLASGFCHFCTAGVAK
jgi:hypothetical protein